MKKWYLGRYSKYCKLASHRARPRDRVHPWPKLVSIKDWLVWPPREVGTSEIKQSNTNQNKQTKALALRDSTLKLIAALSSRQWDSPQSQGGPAWGLPGKIRPALKPQKPESKEAVCLYYRVYQLKSPAFKEKPWATCFPSKHLFFLPWPRASLPSLTSWGFESAEVFLEAQRKWSWLFSLDLFSLSSSLSWFVPCLTTVGEFKKKGLGQRRETEKGKETDRWRGAWEKPTGTEERRGKN